MADTQNQSQGITKRLPLATVQNNRNNSPLKDGRLVNCYLETNPEGGYSIMKRPGFAPYTSLNVGAGLAAGNFFWSLDNGVYSVVGTNFYRNGVFVGAVDGTVNSQYSFNSNAAGIPTIILGNQHISYAYNSVIGLVTQASLGGVNYPDSTAQPGFCFLDGTMYWLSSAGYIYGSGINDFTVWDPLNSIRAEIEPDNAMVIAKNIIYVVAFKQWTTEIFYDNGNPTGSPLGSDAGGKINYGCAHIYSVKDIDGELFWLGQTKTGSYQFCKVSNLSLSIISTPAIEKLVNIGFLNGQIYTWSYKGEGHKFYIFTSTALNLTLAYDINENLWSQWTDENGNYLPICSSTKDLAGNVVAQHLTNGASYTVSGTHVADEWTTNTLSTITSDIYTPNFDGGVDRRKMITLMRFNGDQTPGSILKVRCNDNDYSVGKWTNFRNVDMNSQRPTLTNCGSFYRRAYHIRHASQTYLRITSVDITFDLGEL